MICIEVIETGERRCIENEVWITENRNGIHRTPHRSKALGIGDGATVWSLGKLEGYPEAKLITLAEYLESLGEQGEEEELSAQEALDIILGGNDETK